jgi:hypothetical protein
VKRVGALVLALIAFVALTILWIVSDRRASQRIYDDYSSQNTSGKGLSLAYGYLAKRHKVAMLTRAIGSTPIEKNAVVVRVIELATRAFDPEDLEEDQFGPPRPRPEPILNEAEYAFVRDGGRLVIAAKWLALDTRDAGKVAKRVFPIWPGVGDLQLPQASVILSGAERSRRIFSSGTGEDPSTSLRMTEGFSEIPPRMHAVFASNTVAIVARERIGSGDLFLISVPQLLQNDGLAHGNHLQLLSALAGDHRPVYFDEVPHGIVSDDGSLALLKEWNIGPCLVLVAIAAIVFFWRAARRIGPPVDDYRETRSDAVDLVRSLGALYQRVTSYSESLSLYHDALTRTVAMQTGLRGEALHKRVAELTGGATRDLNALNEAFMKIQQRR